MANYESTGIPCLVRDADSGVYYARAKVRGRIFFRSLDATKITTAKLRLPDKLKEIREEVPDEKPSRNLELKSTFLYVATLYESDVNADSRLEPSTAYVRVRPLATLRRTRPDVFAMEIRRITPKMVKDYMADYERGKWPYLPPKAKAKTRAGNSPSTVNKMIACLRNVFDIAVKAHVIAKKPAAELTYMPVKKKLLQLPNRSQFSALVHHTHRLNHHDQVVVRIEMLETRQHPIKALGPVLREIFGDFFEDVAWWGLAGGFHGRSRWLAADSAELARLA